MTPSPTTVVGINIPHVLGNGVSILFTSGSQPVRRLYVKIHLKRYVVFQSYVIDNNCLSSDEAGMLNSTPSKQSTAALVLLKFNKMFVHNGCVGGTARSRYIGMTPVAYKPTSDSIFKVSTSW